MFSGPPETFVQEWDSKKIFQLLLSCKTKHFSSSNKKYCLQKFFVDSRLGLILNCFYSESAESKVFLCRKEKFFATVQSFKIRKQQNESESSGKIIFLYNPKDSVAACDLSRVIPYVAVLVNNVCKKVEKNFHYLHHSQLLPFSANFSCNLILCEIKKIFNYHLTVNQL